MAIAGIYNIIHLATRKTYVGQSNDVHGRLAEHRSLLNKGAHHCRDLQRLWTTNVESFTFKLVEQAPEGLKGYALQSWLNERETSYFRILSHQGLCLNSVYPTLVHSGNSEMEMLDERKFAHKTIATDAEAKRKTLATQLSAKSKELNECSSKITAHESVLRRTTGFFAFIFGRSNPFEADKARSALKPLYVQRQVLQKEHDELWQATYEHETTRRRNNSAARSIGSRQKQIKARKKRRQTV